MSSSPNFSDKQRVAFHQTDMAGIVHFSEFFRYMETAEHAFFRSLGISVHMKLEDGDLEIGWPRVACGFEYMRPLRFEDVFEVQLFIEKVGGSSLSLRAEVVKDGVIHAKGTSTSVCCRKTADGMEKISIPDDLREKLATTNADS